MQSSILHLSKIPPQAIELEKAVLAAIMLDRNAYDLVSEILKPECFYAEIHEIIFRSMKDLHTKNKPIDIFTLIEELKSSDCLEKIGGIPYLTIIQKDIASTANLESHARYIFQKYHLRELIKISAEIYNKAFEADADNFELQDYAESSISAIGLNHSFDGMIPIVSVMMDAINKIEEWRHIDGSITGVPSGFYNLDNATRGWQPGDLIILAARPSIGKTAFALNLIKNAASNRIKPVTVGVWSLEMKAVYLGLRMLSAEGDTLLHRIQTGSLNDDEMAELVSGAASNLSNLSIFFEENSNITLQSVTRKAKQLKKRNNLGLIVIDYLQLMSSDSNKGNREQEISAISRGLKNLAQELNIPIIALSQLNRTDGAKGISWDKGPGIYSIRESGAIEQDADLILMLWGADEDEIAQDRSLLGKRKVRIAKARNGVLITEELNFKNDIQLFENIEGFLNNQSTFKSIKNDNGFEF